MTKALAIVYNILLITASGFGLVSLSTENKKFAMTASALYLASGCSGLAGAVSRPSSDATNEPPNEPAGEPEDRSKIGKYIDYVDDLFYNAVNTAGIELLVVDVCITSNIDPRLSYVLLIIPAVDLLMKIVERRTTSSYNWKSISPALHIISVALLYNFAIKDARPILAVAGSAFCLAVFTNRKGYNEDVTGYNAFGVISTVWFLLGKDFQDFHF